MRVATVTEAKNGLSAVLDYVKHGIPVLITQHSKPIARIEPVDVADTATGCHMASLAAEGLITPPRKKLALKAFFDMPRPRCDGVVEALLKEREDSP